MICVVRGLEALLIALAALSACVPVGAQTRESASAPTVMLEGKGVGIAPMAGCDLLAEGGDWIDDQERTYRRVVPRPCDVALDDPPLFWWAPLLVDASTRTSGTTDAVRYTLTVERVDGTTPALRVETMHPYARLDQRLGAGEYRWWVSAQAPQRPMLTSRVRRFAIDAARAGDTRVPDAAQALGRLVDPARARPRMFPAGTKGAAILTQATAGERYREYTLAYTRAEHDARADARSAADPVNSAQTLSAITVLGIVWRLSGRERFADAGRARLLALADAPAGACGYAEDIARMQNALALARGLDLFADTLSAPEHQQVVQAALARIQVCTNGLLAADSFTTSFAYRSHESFDLQLLMQALALLAGETPEADRLFVQYWDLYASAAHVWGVQDGSDVNGTGYGWLNFIALPATFLTLRNALGADYFSQRAFFRNAGLRLAYLSPPVAPFTLADGRTVTGPINVFGDGESDIGGAYWFKDDIDRAFRVYSELVDDPLYRWYRRQGMERFPSVANADFEPEYRALSLLAPMTEHDHDDNFPVGTPPFQAFPDAGIVAMHDDLADPKRTSLYFISSPFGAYSHAAAEQNSFVLHMAGEPVLINAGYYDAYMSAHHAGYTRHTRAKNALTYDGGRGQAETVDGRLVVSAEFSGRLLNAWSGDRIDVATGDATAAYRLCNGQPMNPGCTQPALLAPIRSALRSVAHLREPKDKAYVIYDRIEADAPHVWEWNLHAYQPFEIVARGSPYTLRAYGPSRRTWVCVDVYGPPLELTQTDDFPVAPTPDDHALRLPQWHAVLRTRESVAGATFVAILRERCETRHFEIDLDQYAGTARVTIGGADAHVSSPTRLTFDRKQVHIDSAAKSGADQAKVEESPRRIEFNTN